MSLIWILQHKKLRLKCSGDTTLSLSLFIAIQHIYFSSLFDFCFLKPIFYPPAHPTAFFDIIDLTEMHILLVFAEKYQTTHLHKIAPRTQSPRKEDSIERIDHDTQSLDYIERLVRSSTYLPLAVLYNGDRYFTSLVLQYIDKWTVKSVLLLYIYYYKYKLVQKSLLISNKEESPF